MVGEGLNLAVSHIDSNLHALDECVNHCHRECETNEAVLELYKAQLEELEKLFDTQSVHMVELESKIDSVACRCGSSKGKDREEATSILDSPIVLASSPVSSGSSNLSYMAPPITNESSATLVQDPSTSSLTLVDDEDKENESRPGIGAITALGCLDCLPTLLSSSTQEYVDEARSILQDHTLDIVGVRGQRAFRSLGPPKSRFHPYDCPGSELSGR